MADRYDENLFLGYLEGELSAEDRARFEAEMAADPRLKSLVEAMASDRAALRGMADKEPPAEVFERVSQQLEREMLLEPTDAQVEVVAGVQRWRMKRWVMYGGVAALVMVSAGVVLVTLMGVPGSQKPASPSVAVNPQPGGAKAGESNESSKQGTGQLAMQGGGNHEEMTRSGLDRSVSEGRPGAPAATKMKATADSVNTGKFSSSNAMVSSDYTVQVATDDVATAREQVLAWAKTNNATVLGRTETEKAAAQKVNGAAAGGGQGQAMKDGGRVDSDAEAADDGTAADRKRESLDGAEGKQTEVVLIVEPGQLASLKDYIAASSVGGAANAIEKETMGMGPVQQPREEGQVGMKPGADRAAAPATPGGGAVATTQPAANEKMELQKKMDEVKPSPSEPKDAGGEGTSGFGDTRGTNQQGPAATERVLVRVELRKRGAASLEKAAPPAAAAPATMPR